SRYCIRFFFFQAEDGIRDLIVTGVQTCALPIFAARLDAARNTFTKRKIPRRAPVGAIPWREAANRPDRIGLGKSAGGLRPRRASVKVDAIRNPWYARISSGQHRTSRFERGFQQHSSHHRKL